MNQDESEEINSKNYENRYDESSWLKVDIISILNFIENSYLLENKDDNLINLHFFIFHQLSINWLIIFLTLKSIGKIIGIKKKVNKLAKSLSKKKNRIAD